MAATINPRRGTENNNAKITDEDVRYIRREAEAGRTGADLARQFGISTRAARAVINYETWIHVHG